MTIMFVTAGCLGWGNGASPTPTMSQATPTPDSSSTSTATPLPPGTIQMPKGPKDRPERPPELNHSSVRKFVRTYEYNAVYNRLWMGEESNINLDCRVDQLTERSWGYEVVVTCDGYSESPDNATASPGVHVDWFGQTFRYRVGEDTIHRDYVPE